MDRANADDPTGGPLGAYMVSLQLLGGFLIINGSGAVSRAPALDDTPLRVLDGDLNLGNVDLQGNGNGGSDTIYRLREGIERFMITDINNPAGSASAQSTVAVMWDVINLNMQDDGGASFNHVPGGGNVLYMDGHVEWSRYQAGNDFPINEGWAAVEAYVSGAL